MCLGKSTTVCRVNVITLYRARDLWVARHSGAAARSLVDLFNTDTLPTAYRASADAERVLLAIQALNPDWIVELACDCQRCGEPILRDQPAPAPAGYHLGCRPGAGRIPYRLPERFDAGDPFDLGTNGERDA